MQMSTATTRASTAAGRTTAQPLGHAAPKPAALSRQTKPLPSVFAAACQGAPLVHLQQADVVEARSIPLSTLVAMAAEGQLQLQEDPSNLVHNSRKMASSLVVPVLQGKATPPVVLQGVGQGQLRVCGGSQRLRSLLAFVSGSSDIGGQHWPNAPVELDSRDGAFIRWNGKRFSQLPEATQLQVAQYTLDCVIMKHKPDSEAEFGAATAAGSPVAAQPVCQGQLGAAGVLALTV